MSIHVYHTKTDCSVSLVKSKCIYTSDGSQCFSLDSLFKEDSSFPRTGQELIDTFLVILEFGKGGQASHRYAKMVIEEKDISGPAGGLLWATAGVSIHVFTADGRQHADFMLLSSTFSEAAQLRMSMRMSVQAQRVLEVARAALKSCNKEQRQREKARRKNAKKQEETEEDKKTDLWNRSVARICILGAQVLGGATTIHAGTVLKLAAPDPEDFGEFFDCPRFRRLEFKMGANGFVPTTSSMMCR